MSNTLPNGPRSGLNPLLTLFLPLLAVAVTFFAMLSELAIAMKTIVVLAAVAAYLVAFYLLHRRPANDSPAQEQAESLLDAEAKLLALEEANEFFGASLNPADMFRLVASRLGEIVAFDSCVLFSSASENDFLEIKYAAGANAELFGKFRGDVHRSLAARVFMRGEAEIDDSLSLDRTVFSPPTLGGCRSAMAVPLARETEIFAVLVLYSGEKNVYDERALDLFKAAAARVAPLFASSLTFERSVSNALVDPLTSLPNERAFFLVLENQTAEAMRYRDERQLTVLAVDIHNFAEINDKFGHAVGDRILAFTADLIRRQLRQMDVLSRLAADEFVAVLPTAAESIAYEVAERIREALAANPFQLSGVEYIHFHLNFGAATFWRDGETAVELLQTARARKKQAKAKETAKILWFPKEYIN